MSTNELQESSRESDARPDMEGLIREITLRNFLSFGPDTPPLQLGPLNLLIGPNGSGKSNLIEAIAVARATAADLPAVLRKGGGPAEWIWKGGQGAASLDLVIDNSPGRPLRHYLEFQAQDQRLVWLDERIEARDPAPGKDAPYFFYKYQAGRPVLSRRQKQDERSLQREHFDLGASILTQIKDPDEYPEITRLARSYNSIRIYREWYFGRSNPVRSAQPADGRFDQLDENCGNLGLFLNHLRTAATPKREIQQHLRDLYPELSDFDVRVAAGTVQIFLTEGDIVMPATRLSDGTLRYLCLLAILCDPAPPKLICLEEPELGLHPDLLPTLADLLIRASRRTQLIVTTHSEILVDAFTETPEHVLICEKHQGVTGLKRLNSQAVARALPSG